VPAVTLELPPSAAWRHVGARNGFEALFARAGVGGYRFEGSTSAVEDGEAWVVEYGIAVDTDWVTRSAHIVGRSVRGRRDLRLERDDAGEWRVNGALDSRLRGCVEIDLEASVATNALPVRRLGLQVGQVAEPPAVYVRALDLSVERLEQRYLRLDDEHALQRYEYGAPRFDYVGQLVYDARGLLLDYPGLAERVR
jgi:hypothetical protein